jgi:hypothetical protein
MKAISASWPAFLAEIAAVTKLADPAAKLAATNKAVDGLSERISLNLAQITEE